MNGPDLSTVYHVMHDVMSPDQRRLLLDEIMQVRIANMRASAKESEKPQ